MREDLIWTHAVGDGLTAFAYFLIPVLLFYITRKYKFDKRLKFVFSIYGLFIFLCGSTHVMDVVMIWWINGFIITFDGYLRLLTGLISIFSAGVTIWAATIFLNLFSEMIDVFKRMKKERREQQRVSNETWEQFRAAMSQVEDVIRGK